MNAHIANTYLSMNEYHDLSYYAESFTNTDRLNDRPNEYFGKMAKIFQSNLNHKNDETENN